MKKASAWLLLAVVLTTVAGCSDRTRNDIKDDINEGAADLNRKAQDALD